VPRVSVSVRRAGRGPAGGSSHKERRWPDASRCQASGISASVPTPAGRAPRSSMRSARRLHSPMWLAMRVRSPRSATWSTSRAPESDTLGSAPWCRGRPHGRPAGNRQDAARPGGRRSGGRAVLLGNRVELRGDFRRSRGQPGVRDLLYRATDGGRAASAVTDITSTHIGRGQVRHLARRAGPRPPQHRLATMPESNQSYHQGGGDYGVRTSARRDGAPSRPRY
jgi:hypothetical protein